MRNAASWSFTERDAERVDAILRALLDSTAAHRALLVDRTGQLIASMGELPVFDSTAFASVVAADFAANDQIASLLGETDFASLFHQGQRESVYLLNVAGRAILVVLFDREVTLGMIRIRARHAGRALNEVFAELRSRPLVEERLPRFEAGWATEAEDQIDRLFGGS